MQAYTALVSADMDIAEMFCTMLLSIMSPCCICTGKCVPWIDVCGLVAQNGRLILCWTLVLLYNSLDLNAIFFVLSALICR